MHLSRIPAGMRYYVGDEARLRRRVEDTAMGVFDRWSYEEITTPSVDYYALFEHGMGATEAQRSFRFTDQDGRLLTLRPDVTSSVARAAATLLSDRPRPLRLCYAAPVFQQQSHSAAEWRRENTQLGCELIGAGDASADVEVLLVAAEILQQLGLQDSCCITLNHVGIFNGLAEQFSLDANAREEVRQLIDSRAIPELNRYSNDVLRCNSFADLVHLKGKQEVIQPAQELASNARSGEALAALAELWQALETKGLTGLFEIDLGDVSSLDYYTGLSFKVFISGAGSRVGGGGRYDGLIGNFGMSEPAIGFVLNLDGLTEVISRRNQPQRTQMHTDLN
ncbi:MAG TPA: ATP phosphoribosyltransferase regulatory subunit [Pyrinomonadaceae bacterium]